MMRGRRRTDGERRRMMQRAVGQGGKRAVDGGERERERQ
jgi:hypothetical protein